MIAEVGHFSLLLALALSLIQGIAPIWGAMRGDVQLMRLSSVFALGQFVFVLLAFFCLLFVYVVSDFSVLNVWHNSHSSKPMIYKITAVWGNHEGSMLLWVSFLSLFSALLALFGRDLSMRLKANALAVQGWIGSAFLLFLIFTSNPFVRLDPAPIDGQGFNPVLQDFALAIHPPLLYMGYVGFSVAFSLAIAALIEGKTDAIWALRVRPWVLLSWMLLTGGIATGSWWAYYELGWGGWWVWDPVENASLMPWLSGTAMLHSVIVMEKREALKIWTVFLAILTFSLSLLGTFIVRSGVLTSVHAFAVDPMRGLFILCILSLFVGGGFAIFMWRAPVLRQGGLFAPISREGAIILNNLLLVSALTSVLIGTFYPLFLEYLSGVKISVGTPFFNMTFGSLMCLSFIILPFAQMLSWRHGDLSGVVQRLSVVAGIAILGAMVSVWVNGKYSLLAFLGIALALWVIVGAVFEAVWRIKLFRAPLNESLRILKKMPRSAMGNMLAHAGVGVTMLGIVSVSTWREEVITLMSPGDSITIADYVVVLDDIFFRQGANYVERVGRFSVHREDVIVRVIKAARRRYIIPIQTTSEVGIGMFPTRDVYIVLGDMTEEEKNVVHVYSSPLVMLIWGGAGLMILGGLSSLYDRRLYTYKLRRPPLSKPDPASRLHMSCCAFVILLSVFMDGRGVLAAIQPDEILNDPMLESRARELSVQFRCVVCQSQSINESDATLARAMRIRVRDRLKMGDSDEEVIAHLVARYGDFILLKPPLQTNTLFLWGLPPFVFLLGTCIVGHSVIKRRHDIGRAQRHLSPDEERRVRVLLDEFHSNNDVS